MIHLLPTPLPAVGTPCQVDDANKRHVLEAHHRPTKVRPTSPSMTCEWPPGHITKELAQALSRHLCRQSGTKMTATLWNTTALGHMAIHAHCEAARRLVPTKTKFKLFRRSGNSRKGWRTAILSIGVSGCCCARIVRPWLTRVDSRCACVDVCFASTWKANVGQELLRSQLPVGPWGKRGPHGRPQSPKRFAHCGTWPV